jgi:hypothetical protein
MDTKFEIIIHHSMATHPEKQAIKHPNRSFLHQKMAKLTQR